MQSAIARHQGIDVRIIQRPHYDLHGMSLKRVKERPHFPSPKMRRQQQDAFTALLGRLKILEPLIHRDGRRVLPGITREEASLAQQPSQRNINAAQDFAPLRRSLLRQRDLQIAPPHPPQPGMQVVHRPPIMMPTPCAIGRGSSPIRRTNSATGQYCNL